MVATGESELTKIKNTDVPSDILTKHLAEAKVQSCMEMIECDFTDGRNELAPKFDS